MLNERAGPGSGFRWRTSSSGRPSATNPSFGELLDIGVSLPALALDSPLLEVNVLESLFGGFHTPLLGTTYIHLSNLMPNHPKEEEPPPPTTTVLLPPSTTVLPEAEIAKPGARGTTATGRRGKYDLRLSQLPSLCPPLPLSGSVGTEGGGRYEKGMCCELSGVQFREGR